jgi:hypothetical protein
MDTIDTTKYYHKLDFDLSPAAKQWVVDRYRDKFTEKFYHHDDTKEFFSKQFQDEWHASPVGEEISNFLKTYNCDCELIYTFVCNRDEYYPGNPHIDIQCKSLFNSVLGTSLTEEVVVKTRLNIMVLGNPNDEMVWWGDFHYKNPLLKDVEYIDLSTGHPFTCRNVPGATKEDRLKFVGTPDCVARNILTPSAFVKTDCAHTVNCSPVPRIIITVPLDKSIDELLSFANV